jgi:hypothetical protein
MEEKWHWVHRLCQQSDVADCRYGDYQLAHQRAIQLLSGSSCAPRCRPISTRLPHIDPTANRGSRLPCPRGRGALRGGGYFLRAFGFLRAFEPTRASEPTDFDASVRALRRAGTQASILADVAFNIFADYVNVVAGTEIDFPVVRRHPR